MTPSQKKAVEWFKREFFDYNSHVTKEDYEYKEWEVQDHDYGMVSIVAEVGMKNDEGTMAAVFCRARKHVFIGKKGGFSWYDNNAHKRVNARKYSCEIYFPERN